MYYCFFLINARSHRATVTLLFTHLLCAWINCKIGPFFVRIEALKGKMESQTPDADMSKQVPCARLALKAYPQHD